MDKKLFVIMFMVAFIGATIYMYQNNDRLISQIEQNSVSNPLTALGYYFVSHIEYILIFITIVWWQKTENKNLLKTIIGSGLFIYAIDILSFPRLKSIPEGVMNSVANTGSSVFSNSDSIVFNYVISKGIPYEQFYTFYYLFLPIIFIILALTLFGWVEFHKKLTNGGS